MSRQKWPDLIAGRAASLAARTEYPLFLQLHAVAWTFRRATTFTGTSDEIEERLLRRDDAKNFESFVGKEISLFIGREVFI